MKKLLAKIKKWLKKNLVYIAAGFSVTESLFHAGITISGATYLFTTGALGGGLFAIAFALLQVTFACFLANRAVKNRKSSHLTLVVA